MVNERYRSYSSFLREQFGQKMYKICLDGGFTCPNRDGTLSDKGCLFCSGGGSGEYIESSAYSITEQIKNGRRQTRGKYQGDTYIAYFQAYTNTYAPVYKLKKLYMEALEAKEIAAIAIGTRPDCLSEEVLSLLNECNQIKPVFIELGLQTCHDETAARMNRGYKSIVFEEACMRLSALDIRICVHLILGLPGEDMDMILESVDYINRLPVSGVKLSMLHILEGSPLADIYRQTPFSLFTPEDYTDCIIRCIERLRPDIVIERMTGDGPSDLLIAPRWSLKKGMLLNRIHHELKVRDSWQGKDYWDNNYRNNSCNA